MEMKEMMFRSLPYPTLGVLRLRLEREEFGVSEERQSEVEYPELPNDKPGKGH